MNKKRKNSKGFTYNILFFLCIILIALTYLVKTDITNIEDRGNQISIEKNQDNNQLSYHPLEIVRSEVK